MPGNPRVEAVPNTDPAVPGRAGGQAAPRWHKHGLTRLRAVQAHRWLPGLVRFVLRGHALRASIPTHTTLAERAMLYRLGLQSGAGCNLVEIGAYLGASSRFLAAAARERAGKLYCIDTWQNHGMTEGQRDTHTQFLENMRDYSAWIVGLRGWSHEMIKQAPSQADLVFIDGDHSYQGVRDDLRLWLPRLSQGGWVVLHDYGWAEGVRQAVAEEVTPLLAGRPIILPNLYAARIRARGAA